MSNYGSRHDTVEKRREYDKLRKRNLRDMNGEGLRGKRFVAVDGEGGNDGDEDDPKTRHWYMLLAAGDQSFYTNNALTSLQCLNFLADLPVKGVCYVAYFFDYDVTMIIRQLPKERIARLLDRDNRTTKGKDGYPYTHPVDYMGYQIDYMPHKEFMVRRAVPYGQKTNPWVVINDVGSFFQCSFVEAITTWDIGTPEERLRIAEGKDKRAQFQSLEKETIEYNELELKLIAALMEAYRTVCEDIGYLPGKWQGPGNLATAMLKRHGVPKNDEINVPMEVLGACRDAYYGGRFETTAAGPIPGPVYAYDINSAYPDALTKLPCLIHGEWVKIDPVDFLTMANKPGLYIAHGVYEVIPGQEGVGLFNFQHRTLKGSIKCPSSGSGWYWSVEIDQAVHQTFIADTIWAYVKNCACAPFDWVPHVYAARLKLGKSGRGMVLKLALNSIYGKLCQSVGQAPYANPVWGSLITALVRAKLMSISHGDMLGRVGTGGTVGMAGTCLCEHVYMLATDAVFTTVDLGIVGDKVLGGWDKVVHENLFIIQPGLYFKGKMGKGEMPKTRGVPRKLVIERETEFREAFKRITFGEDSQSVAVTVPIKQFIGIRLASHRGNLESAGQWVWAGKDGSGKHMRFDWQRKRASIPWREPVMEQDGSEMYDMIHTSPRIEWVGESTPYSKDIGNMVDEVKLKSGAWDQPDWAPELKAYSNMEVE